MNIVKDNKEDKSFEKVSIIIINFYFVNNVWMNVYLYNKTNKKYNVNLFQSFFRNIILIYINFLKIRLIDMFLY